MKWYMVSTISGKEKEVIEFLKNRIYSEQFNDEFEDFEIMMAPYISPRELEKKQKNLKYKISERNIYPGYIFIKMNMSNETWFLVRNTEYVTGLVGSSGQNNKPTPVSENEMKKMRNTVQKIRDDFKAGIFKTPYTIGMMVEITDGPSKGQIGPILEKNDVKRQALVELIMFGRKTPVDIEYKNIKIKK